MSPPDRPAPPDLRPHATKFNLAVRRVILPAIAASLLGTTCMVRADEEEISSPVDLLMEQISRDLKKLSRQFDNEASRASSLELIDAMLQSNNEAKALVPASVGDRTGAEREIYLRRYQEGMEELGRCLTSLKTALASGDAGKTEALIDEAYALRKKYHDELL
jgi:soluble cytochrome b562